MTTEQTAEKLLHTIQESTCAFTTARYAAERLKTAGFAELSLEDDWDLEKGGKYYVNVYDSCIFAFSVGKRDGMLKIAAAHTDHPCLYVKPAPEMRIQNYGKLNTEIYGGAILNTWLDRPLSLAGRITFTSDDCFHPAKQIVDLKEPLFTIPNLAIHLNREINKGIELNRQTDMLPLCTMLNENDPADFLSVCLADRLHVEKESILDYELYLYNAEPGCLIGLNHEFISAPRIDNISSVEACVNGILKDSDGDGIHLIALYDNEEIGSRTKQGADSVLLSIVLEKIYQALHESRTAYLNKIISGFLLSLDVAHGFHPNKPEKSDPTNINLLNRGIVIKRASSQTYATDCESISILEQLCRKEGIAYQKYASRSDGTTGSTLGTIAGKYLPMHSADVGIPILAMHSARETMGVQDQINLEKLVLAYFAGQ